jgi:triosephosphate isomerase
MSARRKIVAANWKMNLLSAEADSLVKEICAGYGRLKDVQCILFPPFTLIRTVIEAGKGSSLQVGAQNCSEHEKGAFTGEVSAAMIADTGCTHVLIGHSERRTHFRENNTQLTAKIVQALKNGLDPVFCIGESISERRSEKHFDAVGIQLHEVLSNFNENDLARMVIAYEPVWAIGTGLTATPAQAQEMHAYIRRTVKEMFGVDAALSTSVLYGGSCNPQNAKELFSCPDVDGGLIGGASLKSADFSAILHSF